MNPFRRLRFSQKFVLFLFCSLCLIWIMHKQDYINFLKTNFEPTNLSIDTSTSTKSIQRKTSVANNNSENKEIIAERKNEKSELNNFELPHDTTALISEEKFQNNLQYVAGIFGIKLDDNIKSDRIEVIGNRKKRRRSIITNDMKILRFDAESYAFRSYNCANTLYAPPNLNWNSAIKKSKVLEIAKDIFAKLEISAPEHLTEDDININDGMDISEKDLHGAEWTLSKRYTYSGYEILSASVTLSVSAYDGTIVGVYYHPIDEVPDTIQSKIGQEEAKLKAEKFLLQLTYTSKHIEIVGKTQQYIVYPNNLWDQTLFQNDSAVESAEKPKLCWVITFVRNKGGRPLQVYIDSKTGEVVGGRR